MTTIFTFEKSVQTAIIASQAALTEEEVRIIKGFNDQISLQDVTDLASLVHLIHIYKRTRMIWLFQRNFLNT